MPVSVDDVNTSWGDDDDLEKSLPPPSEVFENGLKIVTEYKIDDQDKKVKVVRTYKIEKRIVSKVRNFKFHIRNMII